MDARAHTLPAGAPVPHGKRAQWGATSHSCAIGRGGGGADPGQKLLYGEQSLENGRAVPGRPRYASRARLQLGWELGLGAHCARPVKPLLGTEPAVWSGGATSPRTLGKERARQRASDASRRVVRSQQKRSHRSRGATRRSCVPGAALTPWRSRNTRRRAAYDEPLEAAALTTTSAHRRHFSFCALPLPLLGARARQHPRARRRFRCGSPSHATRRAWRLRAYDGGPRVHHEHVEAAFATGKRSLRARRSSMNDGRAARRCRRRSGGSARNGRTVVTYLRAPEAGRVPAADAPRTGGVAARLKRGRRRDEPIGAARADGATRAPCASADPRETTSSCLRVGGAASITTCSTWWSCATAASAIRMPAEGLVASNGSARWANVMRGRRAAAAADAAAEGRKRP